jgi:hypothetical protein
MKTRKFLPRPAIVIACLALLFSVSGSAYAAATASPNSVRSRSVVDRTLQGRDIKVNTLGSMVIRDNGVQRADVADGAVAANHLTEVLTVTASSPATVDADGTPNNTVHGVAKATAVCPEGTLFLSGGARWVDNTGAGTDDLSTVYLQEQYQGAQNGWTAEGIVNYGAQGSIRLQAQAFCLTGEIPPL